MLVDVLAVAVANTCPVPSGRVHAPAKAAEGADKSPSTHATQRFNTLYSTPNKRRDLDRQRQYAIASRASGVVQLGNRLREQWNAADPAPHVPGDRRYARGEVIGDHRFRIG